nr:MAG TPA: hypothetical protein [Herelleviridae sp.]
MNLVCRHRLDGQDFQQMCLDRLILKLNLAGLRTALGVPLVQLCQFSGGVSSQLVAHISVDDSIEELTISHNFLLSYGG